MHKKLFIPGPTEVRDEILVKMGAPVIGHRSREFAELLARVNPKIRKFMYTDNHVFLSTSSATGLMEAAVRNCVKKRCLNLVCGGFSRRWHDITIANGKAADVLEVEWGRAIKPEMLREKLDGGDYDAVTLVHNETSTGILNPLYDISKVMKKYPDVMFLVDTVSSMGGTKIEVDKLGIDVCLFGVQKAVAVPPGLSICSVSERALERAKEVENRGYYFDFLVFLKYLEKGQLPTTPSIAHIFALDAQFDRIFEEGLDDRFLRHKRMADMVRGWAREKFALFAEPGYESDTLTVIKNTRGINVADLCSELEARGFLISNGYGPLKEKTFRIGHMGDIQPDEVKELLDNIDDILK